MALIDLISEPSQLVLYRIVSRDNTISDTDILHAYNLAYLPIKSVYSLLRGWSENEVTLRHESIIYALTFEAIAMHKVLGQEMHPVAPIGQAIKSEKIGDLSTTYRDNTATQQDLLNIMTQFHFLSVQAVALLRKFFIKTCGWNRSGAFTSCNRGK